MPVVETREECMPTKKPKPTDVLVGQRVRMARLMANMSQTELGEHIGITFQQVQKYEKGGNRISSSRLAQISEVLGKPVSWFFNEGRGRALAKTSGAADVLQKMLTIRGGVALAEAFTRIRSASLRRHIIDLAKSIADETRNVRSRTA
jgi:transcriptional regulator with XRE-family HTH domain